MKVSCILISSVLVLSTVSARYISGTTTPVSRVVDLLNDIAEKVEKDAKKEQDLYETFVCWSKSVIEQKEAANRAAASKIDQLGSKIADLKAGKITLTSEKDDLTKEVADQESDIKKTEATRKKENQDFLSAKDEMNAAMKALASAMAVLKKATAPKKTSMLIAVRQRLSGGLEALAQEQASLKSAVTIGARFLSKADALFLKRVLYGEVPAVDWSKLNRKATFKMNYKARSTKIQAILEKMYKTFQLNLAEATKKEGDTAKQFGKLNTAKKAQLATSNAALQNLGQETAARGLLKQNSMTEKKALEKQVADDKKYIQDTLAALAAKKKEYKARKLIRSGELEAISKAINILHNDDSRDLFKKSFDSQLQEDSFLQIRSTSESEIAEGAASVLRDSAHRSGDERLRTLAAFLRSSAAPSPAPAPSAKTKFKPVLQAIDKMIKQLADDAKQDLKTKEDCESDHMSDTRKAVSTGREVDDMTDKIATLTEDIESTNEKIRKLQADQKRMKGDLDAATKIRNDEHAEWVASNNDDTAAADTVQSARDTLSKFYKDNKLALMQEEKAPTVQAGKSPGSAPATWDASKQTSRASESSGVIQILEMVRQDILKDKAKSKSEEDKAQQAYDKLKKDTEKEIKDLKTSENDEAKVKGKLETDRTDTEKSRGTKNAELDTTMDKMKAVNPSCEFFTVNFGMRRQNRHIELDGLLKAKAILTGGSFAKAEAAGFLQNRNK